MQIKIRLLMGEGVAGCGIGYECNRVEVMMYSNVLHWSRGILGFIVMMLWGVPVAFAGAWSDYLDQATGILASNNQRLDERVELVDNRSVKFTVEVFQTGEIKEVVVINSSGDPNLDAATVASVNGVEKLPTPPASVFLRQFFTPLTFTYAFNPTGADHNAVEASPTGRSRSTPSSTDFVSATPAVPDKQVIRVQRTLIEKGYDPGPVDGLYGSATASAIRAFQLDHSLDADGRVSKQLIGMLENSNTRELAQADVDSVQTTAEEGSDSSSTVPPTSGKFSGNRELVEDYEYIGDRQVEYYDF